MRKHLRNIAALEEMAPEKVRGFVETFVAFNKVVEACYGKHLSPDYKQNILDFEYCYTNLKISVTPKIHHGVNKLQSHSTATFQRCGKISKFVTLIILNMDSVFYRQS